MRKWNYKGFGVAILGMGMILTGIVISVYYLTGNNTPKYALNHWLMAIHSKNAIRAEKYVYDSRFQGNPKELSVFYEFQFKHFPLHSYKILTLQRVNQRQYNADVILDVTNQGETDHTFEIRRVHDKWKVFIP